MRKKQAKDQVWNTNLSIDFAQHHRAQHPSIVFVRGTVNVARRYVQYPEPRFMQLPPAFNSTLDSSSQPVFRSSQASR